MFHKMRAMRKIGVLLWIGGMLLMAQQAMAQGAVSKKATPPVAKSTKPSSTSKAPMKGPSTAESKQEAASSSATRQTPRFLSVHDDWQVFRTEDASPLCYTITYPTKSTGTYTKRAPPYMIVTQRDAQRYEISVSAGYVFKPNAVTLSIDHDRAYDLFTQEDRAWAYDAKADRAIVESMVKHYTVEVVGHSLKESTSHDTYSLRGLSEALKVMQHSCPATPPSTGTKKAPKVSEVKKPAEAKKSSAKPKPVTKASAGKSASKSSNP